MKAANGMVVTMHYTLTNDGGEMLDSSRDSEPLAYLHGHGNIIPGLGRRSKAVWRDTKRTWLLPPTEGYGEKNAELVFETRRDQFPSDMTFALGERVYAEGPSGPISFTIMELTDTGAVLDGNHPLAGQTLHFDVEILEIRTASKEELTHGHVHTAPAVPPQPLIM